LWNAQHSVNPLKVRLKSGTSALIRPTPSTDFNVFYEVFVKCVYRPHYSLDPASVRLIVDLGANVGYSNLFWFELFPDAEVLTYEPHPRHVALASKNLQMNGLVDRVEVRAAAAGTCAGQAMLSDCGAESAIVDGASESAVPVQTVDFFADLPRRPIDILKIDIEGGEYALLRDRRFDAIRPRLVCLEVHPDREKGIDERQAVDLWSRYWLDAGYEVSMRDGILWAARL